MRILVVVNNKQMNLFINRCAKHRSVSVEHLNVTDTSMKEKSLTDLQRPESSLDPSRDDSPASDSLLRKV